MIGLVQLSFNLSTLPCLVRNRANWSSGHGTLQFTLDSATCWILLMATLKDDSWKSLAVTVSTNVAESFPSFSGASTAWQKKGFKWGNRWG